jgi:hypothetical protein
MLSSVKVLEGRALLEIENANMAETTAENIEHEYQQALYILVQNIQSYLKQRGIIK